LDKRLIVVAFIVPGFLLLYSALTHIRLQKVLMEIPAPLYLYFALGYMAQAALISIRDSEIVLLTSSTKLRYTTALKARLLSNFVGFLIPGSIGGDAARAMFYLREGVGASEALSASVAQGFFDTVTASAFFLILDYLEPLSPVARLTLTLLASLNLVLWLGLLLYFHSWKEINALEKSLLKLIPKDWLWRLYSGLKLSITKPVITLNSAPLYVLTLLGYVITALPFVPLLHDFPKALLVNQLYQLSSVIPIPGYAGVSELALSAALPPAEVVQVRILEIMCVLVGAPFLKEISIVELRRSWERMRGNGEVHQ
jgi:hypothetical protein